MTVALSSLPRSVKGRLPHPVPPAQAWPWEREGGYSSSFLRSSLLFATPLAHTWSLLRACGKAVVDILENTAPPRWTIGILLWLSVRWTELWFLYIGKCSEFFAYDNEWSFLILPRKVLFLEFVLHHLVVVLKLVLST